MPTESGRFTDFVAKRCQHRMPKHSASQSAELFAREGVSDLNVTPDHSRILSLCSDALDIFHVPEHLGKAALCFYNEGRPQAREFVTERFRMLLRGKAGRMIGGLKQMLSKHELSNAARHTLNHVMGYLERNRKHIRYEIYLARGYPIGSGVIEGACRNLINDRLELTGMSWSPQGAEAVMPLRAVHLNKDWDSFWDYRRTSERKRLWAIQHTDSREIREEELRCAA